MSGNRLISLLYERGYQRGQILSLYRYIDWLMALPPELEEKLDQEIDHYEEAQKMAYMTSMERRGYQRGIEAGLEQGREVGLQEGREVGLQEGRQVGLHEGELLTARAAMLEVLQIRFGELPPVFVERMKLLSDLPMLRQLLKKAVIVPSIAEFETELMPPIATTTANEPLDSQVADNDLTIPDM